MAPKALRSPGACSIGVHIDTQGSPDRLESPDLAIAQLAQAQHGIVARWQLQGLGLTDGQINGRLRRGRLHLVHRGVYAVGHRVLRTEGRWIAAVMACGQSASLSHRSAAELWRLIHRSGRSIEVTRATGWRGPSGVTLHKASLPADEICVVDGIQTTTMPRTIFDLAAVAPARQLEKALNEAAVRRLADKLSIPDLLARYPRRPGSVVLRALLQGQVKARGVTRSDLEDLFVAILARTDLPRPRLNADVSVGGRFYEADCLWVKQRLIVELDSREVHGTDRAFEKDRERDRLLMTEGWRVARVTWRQLQDDAPAVLADLRTLLRA